MKETICYAISELTPPYMGLKTARSIVTKDVPPYSVFIGNKVHGKRFADTIIEKVKDIDFSRVCHTKDDAYGDYCTQQASESNADKIMEAFTPTPHQTR